jgi:hypothetical protein
MAGTTYLQEPEPSRDDVHTPTVEEVAAAWAAAVPAAGSGKAMGS